MLQHYYDFLLALTQINFWSLAVAAVFVLFCVVLFRLDRSSQNTKFFFADFFSSGDWDGKASGPRLCYFGAFLVHSLIALHQQMANKGVDYAMVSLYALIWSGAYIALKAIELKGTPAPVAPPPGADAKTAEATT